MFLFRLIKSFLLFLVLIALLLGGFYAYARYVEPFWLKTTQVTVTSPLLKQDADPLTVVVFSDTHFGDYYTSENFDKVIDAVNENAPDIILFLGDLFDHYNEYEASGNVSSITEAMSQLQASIGKYAVYGNHDYEGRAEEAFSEIMENSGFTVLQNDAVFLKQYNLQIIGVDELLIGYGDTETAKQADNDAFTLVLCHEPDGIDEMLSNPINLMVAGHTHGGQIRTPIKELNKAFLPAKGKNYVRGVYTLRTLETDGSTKKAELYVTSGVGMTHLPFRLACRPEIAVFTLKYSTEETFQR